MYERLPNADLIKNGALSRKFMAKGITTFHQACELVWKLPYGRNNNKADWRLVLSEKKGTCSTKHALLKALSEELRLDVNLVMGIYKMNASNTPGVGDVLSENNIESIPEAHCYLEYRGSRIDLTRYGNDSEEKIDAFLVENKIGPDDVGKMKERFHKNYIRQRYGEEGLKKIWRVRERCISALSIQKIIR